MKVSKAEIAVDDALDAAYRSLDVEVGYLRRQARSEGHLETKETVEDLKNLAKHAGAAFQKTLLTIYERPKEPLWVQLGFGKDRFEAKLHAQMYDRFIQFIKYCCTIPCDTARIMKQKHLGENAADDIVGTLMPLSRKFQDRFSEADEVYLRHQCNCEPDSSM